MSVIFAIILASSIPDTQLQTVEGETDVFPIAFRGLWARHKTECSNPDSTEQVQVSRVRFAGYEGDSVLLKNSGLITHFEGKQEVYTLVGLVASSGEGEVDIGKIRLTRKGDRLHVSRPDVVSEADHLSAKFSFVFCRP